MIIKYTNLNTAFLEIYRFEQNFIYNLISLLKHLMMNEIEVSYFTLLLDNLGWKSEQINEIWLYSTFLGKITKKKCFTDNESDLFLNIFSRKYPNFKESYSKFIAYEKIFEKLEKKY